MGRGGRTSRGMRSGEGEAEAGRVREEESVCDRIEESNMEQQRCPED